MLPTQPSFGNLAALNRFDAFAARRSSSTGLALEPTDFVTSFDAVKSAQHLHGYSATFIKTVMEFVEEHNVVLSFRPLNPWAMALIDAGYPTKPLDVKGKTADWGPHAGFIPVRQSMSKVEIQQEGHVPSWNETEEQEEAEALARIGADTEAGKPIPVPLELPRWRVDQLISSGQMKVHENKQDNTFRMTWSNGKVFEGQLSDGAPPTYKVMLGDKPFYVWGESQGPNTGKPMTADGDILAFSPHISEYGPEDKPRPSVSGRGSVTSLDTEFASRRPSLANIMRKNSSMGQTASLADRGTISERLEKLLFALNRALCKALGREVGNEVARHGPDTSNMWTDMGKNLPALVFAPKRVAGINGVGMANTKDGLKHLFQQAKNAQYPIFGNERWDPDMVPQSERMAFNTGIFSQSPSSYEANEFPFPAQGRRGSAAFLWTQERRAGSPATIGRASPIVFTNPFAPPPSDSKEQDSPDRS